MHTGLIRFGLGRRYGMNTGMITMLVEVRRASQMSRYMYD